MAHTKKRMGIALQELKRKHKGMKLHDGKTIGGKGRLTDVIIDKIQNYYGQAIRDNDSLVNMQNAVRAIYHHMFSPEDDINLSVQHQFCPKDSWYRYWADNSNYSEASCLPPVFDLILNPIFSRLSNEDILGRCLKGLTQNQNKAINEMLWSVCPKTTFCGCSKVLLAVANTVLKFNSGSGNKVTLFNSFGISAGRNMVHQLYQEDCLRIKNEESKVNIVNRIARRKLRAKKHKQKKAKQKPPINLVALVYRKPQIFLTIELISL